MELLICCAQTADEGSISFCALGEEEQLPPLPKEWHLPAFASGMAVMRR
jgi:hypothetical protein